MEPGRQGLQEDRLVHRVSALDRPALPQDVLVPMPGEHGLAAAGAHSEKNAPPVRRSAGKCMVPGSGGQSTHRAQGRVDRSGQVQRHQGRGRVVRAGLAAADRNCGTHFFPA